MNRGRGWLLPAMVIVAVFMVGADCAWAAQSAGRAPQGFWGALFGGTHPLLEAVCFYLFGGLTVLSAVAICFTKDIVRMAIWLFATLGAVAVLYFLLAAHFIGVIQLIVYAGGTLILLIFGVMLTTKSPWVRFEVSKVELVAGGAVSVLLLLALLGLIFGTEWPQGERADPVPVAVLGQELLTTYLVPFEAVSVLLLVVMIGAAYLARQEREK